MENSFSVLPHPCSSDFWAVLDRTISLVSFFWTILPFTHWSASLSLIIKKPIINLILCLISENCWMLLFEVFFLLLDFCFWGCFAETLKHFCDHQSKSIVSQIKIQASFQVPVRIQDDEGLLDFWKANKKVFPLYLHICLPWLSCKTKITSQNSFRNYVTF